jgi:hypothetical protein
MQLLPLVGTLTSLLLVLHTASASRRQENPGAASVPDESKRLAAWVGTWDAEVTMMGETTRGQETCRLECGGLWLITEHSGSFQGQPFQGRGFTGYDPSKGAYSGVWIDSSGGPMSVYTNGRFSADGKSYTAAVEGAGMDGKPARFEYRSTFPDARTRTFEIFQVDGGKRELQMSIRYTRR